MAADLATVAAGYVEEGQGRGDEGQRRRHRRRRVKGGGRGGLRLRWGGGDSGWRQGSGVESGRLEEDDRICRRQRECGPLDQI